MPGTPDTGGPHGSRPPDGWTWLDQARGLAVPSDRRLSGGTQTERVDWMAAQPADGRAYALHLPSAMIAVAGRDGRPSLGA